MKARSKELFDREIPATVAASVKTRGSATVDDALFLRHLFRYVDRRGPSDGRRAIVEMLEARIAQACRLVGTDIASNERRRVAPHSHFGVHSAGELAELFVDDFERMKIVDQTFPLFGAQLRAQGYRARVRGRLFHLFVRNFAPIQNDFLEMATTQIRELNHWAHPERREYLPLLTAKGEEFRKPAIFQQPRKAERIRIFKSSGRIVEYVDDAYVASAESTDGLLWSLLCEIEMKTAGAAGGFGKQIGFSQLRVGAGDVGGVEMIVDGCDEPVRVKPEHVLFSQCVIERNAVSHFSRKAWSFLTPESRTELEKAFNEGNMEEVYKRSDFRYQSTIQGHGDVFRRVTLAINPEIWDAYVQAIWPLLEND